MQAISALCQKYPRKHSVMMNFLSNMLRDDVSGQQAAAEKSSRQHLKSAHTRVVCFFAPSRAALITSGPSWIASSASSRRTPRAKKRAWRTCASSSRTASTRCWRPRSCTCWAKRARARRSRPSTSASSSTGWCWRARPCEPVSRVFSASVCKTKHNFWF